MGVLLPKFIVKKKGILVVQVGCIKGWIKKSTNIGFFLQRMYSPLNQKEDLNPKALR
jgi:hypothetical protein